MRLQFVICWKWESSRCLPLDADVNKVAFIDGTMRDGKVTIEILKEHVPTITLNFNQINHLALATLCLPAMYIGNWIRNAVLQVDSIYSFEWLHSFRPKSGTNPQVDAFYVSMDFPLKKNCKCHVNLVRMPDEKWNIANSLFCLRPIASWKFWNPICVKNFNRNITFQLLKTNMESLNFLVKNVKKKYFFVSKNFKCSRNLKAQELLHYDCYEKKNKQIASIASKDW